MSFLLQAFLILRLHTQKKGQFKIEKKVRHIIDIVHKAFNIIQLFSIATLYIP